jgi:cysteine desulfurase
MILQKIYYFDNNATTRIASEVMESMMPFLTERWGNPSSAYAFGNQLAKEIEAARAKVAALINGSPRDVIFTSCGTESNNTAIYSALATNPGKRHIVTTSVEHSAVIRHCERLRQTGCDVTCLPVESDGSLDLHLLEKSIRPDTAVVSAMWANNETGVIFPIEEIAAICQGKGVLCHTDAVQTPGKLKIDTRSVGVDFLSLSAHKFHAPKGIGALYVKRRTKFQPYLIGGHQEHDRRGGTENVPYIVAMGCAAELAVSHLDEEDTRVRALRDKLEIEILSQIPGATRNGGGDSRLPNTANIAFDGVEAEAVLMALDQVGICASSGSACTTGSLEPSHVLTAMGVPPGRARGSVRFSLGIDNNAEDVDHLLKHLPTIISRLRTSAPGGNPRDRDVLKGGDGNARAERRTKGRRVGDGGAAVAA